MSVTAISIINAAQEIVQDDRGVAYKNGQGLDWINRGQRAIINLRRDAGAVTEIWQLTLGAKQSIPAGGLQILGDPRNMGYDGVSAGDAILRIDRKELDAIYPSWSSSANQAAIIVEYMFDTDHPTVFWVNPPSDGQGYIEASISKVPAVIVDEESDIGIPDQFETALVHYVCWCWLGRDSERSPNYTRAQASKSTFFELLGISAQAKVEAQAT